MACAICETRKEKRFCPAVHGRICAICCGTEREVTLDCPSDCPYLQQARQHERPRDLSDVDPAAWLAQITVPDDLLYHREPLIGGLSYALLQAARRDRSINDRDIIAALTSMAKSLETLVGSGIVYEAPTANPTHQQIVADLQKMVAGYREAEQKRLATILRDSELLQVIVFLLRFALARTNGRPRSRAFLDLLATQFPHADSVIASPQQAGSGLIMP